MSNLVYPAQIATQSLGRLRVDVTSIRTNYPVNNARIKVYDPNNEEIPIEEFTTNTVGQSEEVVLKTPSLDYSMEPSVERPYAEYSIKVEADGFESVYIAASQILPRELALQDIQMLPIDPTLQQQGELFVIPEHTLYGDYPPKIAEAEIKPVNESGEIVLSRVVVPEYVVVHDGPPSDSSAQNYYVRYKDYIKNVASSEIYATWPESTIQANVLAIQSFTLNRVFTEWYRNKGYNFTITSSTAYDHKWMLNRNIFDNISVVVDTIFTNYLSRPNVKQPILTQYCDGNRVQCPNWMTQWGSKYLGDQGKTAIEILRYYYGDNMFINTAQEVAGVPASWPGANLTIGSSGDNVRMIQEQLNVISKGYPLIPKIAEDGIYGEGTANAVKTFQKIFNLPQTGVVDYKTWYKISEIYVGVSRIAELV